MPFTEETHNEWLAWVKVAPFNELLTAISVRERLYMQASSVEEMLTLIDEHKTLLAEIKTRPQYPHELLAEFNGE